MTSLDVAQTGPRAFELIGPRRRDVHLLAGAGIRCAGRVSSGGSRVWLAERAGNPATPAPERYRPPEKLLAVLEAL